MGLRILDDFVQGNQRGAASQLQLGGVVLLQGALKVLRGGNQGKNQGKHPQNHELLGQAEAVKQGHGSFMFVNRASLHALWRQERIARTVCEQPTPFLPHAQHLCRKK